MTQAASCWRWPPIILLVCLYTFWTLQFDILKIFVVLFLLNAKPKPENPEITSRAIAPKASWLTICRNPSISLEEQKFWDFWCQSNSKPNWNNQTACAAVIASWSSAYMVPTSFPGLDVLWSRINLKKYVCVLHVCSWQHYVLNRSLKECLQDKGKASSVQCMRGQHLPANLFLPKIFVQFNSQEYEEDPLFSCWVQCDQVVHLVQPQRDYVHLGVAALCFSPRVLCLPFPSGDLS